MNESFGSSKSYFHVQCLQPLQVLVAKKKNLYKFTLVSITQLFVDCLTLKLTSKLIHMALESEDSKMHRPGCVLIYSPRTFLSGEADIKAFEMKW
jgi:hypothetical protein